MSVWSDGQIEAGTFRRDQVQTCKHIAITLQAYAHLAHSNNPLQIRMNQLRILLHHLLQKIV
jgi:hypothetical protein